MIRVVQTMMTRIPVTKTNQFPKYNFSDLTPTNDQVLLTLLQLYQADKRREQEKNKLGDYHSSPHFLLTSYWIRWSVQKDFAVACVPKSILQTVGSMYVCEW